jgi:hypothetical protein
MNEREQAALYDRVIAAQVGDQVVQMAKMTVEIEALKAQLSKAYADLAAAQKAQVVEE